MIILASKSPRRNWILEQLGLSFRVMPSGFDEGIISEKNSIDLVRKLAECKAKELHNFTDIVIGADVCVVHRGKILGKPASVSDAIYMLKSLSGNAHRVVGGICVLHKDLFLTEHCVSEVTFKELSEKQISDYVATGSPMDKAGSYGITDVGRDFIEKIEGSVTNVMGMSTEKLVPMLKKAGIFINEERLQKFENGMQKII